MTLQLTMFLIVAALAGGGGMCAIRATDRNKDSERYIMWSILMALGAVIVGLILLFGPNGVTHWSFR